MLPLAQPPRPHPNYLRNDHRLVRQMPGVAPSGHVWVPESPACGHYWLTITSDLGDAPGRANAGDKMMTADRLCAESGKATAIGPDADALRAGRNGRC